MLGSIVDTSDIIDVDNAAAVFVQLLESFFYQDKARGCKITPNDTEEFIIVDRAVTVQIEGVENNIDLLIWDFYLEVTHRLSELITVKRL